MKRASRTACIEPAVGAAATQVSPKQNALIPRTVTLGAVLARLDSRHASDVGHEGLDVTTPFNVQLLVRPALDGLPNGGLVGEPLAQQAIQSQSVAIECQGHLSGSAVRLDSLIHMQAAMGTERWRWRRGRCES